VRRRSILFITTDQQRADALGCYGGRVARTPVVDALAARGVRYDLASVHNVVCMPSRSTMLTGQHPRTHGVVANGIGLPDDAPSVAAYLQRSAGYRTALIGKAHFEPNLDPFMRFRENQLGVERCEGPWRGFEHVELALHGPVGGHHYAEWLRRAHPESMHGFSAVLTGAGGGDTGAPEVACNPIPREQYHTDWLAERAVRWLRSLPADEPFFLWLSFPDPHHPFDPPADEVQKRVRWRELDLPAGHPGTPSAIEAILKARPRHWLDWYQGRFRNPEGGPTNFVPAELTHDQVREVNAMIHVENELIDEAVGRVLSVMDDAGRRASTDVLFTSDHGELQGDFGLLFKGPYHVTSLMRIPLIWAPAADAGGAAAVVAEPVGHQDLAPTFCVIAGLPVPTWMDGRPLPVQSGSDRERVITTFDSQFSAVGMHLRTITKQGVVCTAYEPTDPQGGGRFPLYWSLWGRGTQVPHYDGTEGELYDLREDPAQRHNRWADAGQRKRRDALVEELYEHLPPLRSPALKVTAPT